MASRATKPTGRGAGRRRKIRHMKLFSYELKGDTAHVSFDSGSMNTLSRAAIAELGQLVEELERLHADTPLAGVILKGNRYGLGAGADIGELKNSSREQLEELIDAGHETFYRIEEGEVPWVALIDGYALGGIYELALACDGIVATGKSTLGFPEIKLNIFPGLGGTQRMPRRSGLINATDPVAGAAGFTAVLQGGNFKAPAAAAINMIDALVPESEDADSFAEKFLREILPTLDRSLPADLADAESLRELVLPTVQRATGGRSDPRAPYVALDVMIKGASLPLREANRLERDAFIEVASSAQGKAGMRFFFTQQAVQKLPRDFATAAKITRVGVDGADGFMGNAIAWLALEAGYEVVAHVPLPEFADSVSDKLRAKYARLVKKGRLDEKQVEEKIASVTVATSVAQLADCDLVVEARMENREVKAEFYRELGAVMKAGAVVASNSSSMGPGMLTEFFTEGGGDASCFINLHFFSPAENPRMQLVELVRSAASSDESVATAHSFVKKIGKTPVVLGDGSAGFLVNAGLAAYMLAAEQIYHEGTPAADIDAAMKASVFPMGPFELGDMAGVDVTAGMMDTIAEQEGGVGQPLVWALRDAGRNGVKVGAGFYNYSNGAATGEWEGLAALVPGRGDRVAVADEIVERCMKALHAKVLGLVGAGVAPDEEQADLCFVLGLGFAMHLGGPLFYGEQEGWN